MLTYTGGFPTDLGVLDGASTVVLYFDGLQETEPPLLEAARIAQREKIMAAGAGLIALHQASTLPAGNKTVPLLNWLGAKREGMFDRTTEKVALEIAAPTHPVAAGVGPIALTDEFYPTLVFAPGGKVTPILRATLTPQFGDVQKQAASPPPDRAGIHTKINSRPPFGQLWQTPQFDSVEGRAPRLFATPLYVDQVAVAAGQYRAERIRSSTRPATTAMFTR